MNVTFTPDEIRMWAHRGVDRRCSAIERGRRGAHGFNRTDFWELDIEGLLAEAAVAKALGLYYAPVTGALDTALGDVMKGIQVRSTKYDNGCLLVHDSDADDDRFVLVTGSQGNYQIRGWIYASFAKEPRWWRIYKGRGAFWVPQSALHPFKPKELVIREAA